MLEAMLVSRFDSSTPEKQKEFLFIKGGAKVHKGKARLNKGIRVFGWPPSLDLNPIEKV